LTEAIVPGTGARSLVSSSAFCALFTLSSALSTAAWADARLVALDVLDPPPEPELPLEPEPPPETEPLPVLPPPEPVEFPLPRVPVVLGVVVVGVVVVGVVVVGVVGVVLVGVVVVGVVVVGVVVVGVVVAASAAEATGSVFTLAVEAVVDVEDEDVEVEPEETLLSVSSALSRSARAWASVTLALESSSFASSWPAWTCSPAFT
jgi:hypothetical protein